MRSLWRQPELADGTLTDATTDELLQELSRRRKLVITQLSSEEIEAELKRREQPPKLVEKRWLSLYKKLVVHARGNRSLAF